MQKRLALYLPLLGLLAACGEDVIYAGADAFCQTSLNPPASVPTGSGDPFIDAQWHLDRLSITQAWDEDDVNGGDDIHIGIIDGGVEIAHEDLKNNVIEDRSLNFIPNIRRENNPLPRDCDAAHGTNAAGIIAAAGDNGLGIKGVAYRAKIFATNYLASRQGAHLSMSLTRGLQETAISSNSWGENSPTRLISAPQVFFVMPIEMGLTEGHGRRGISYVFAGGNHRNLNQSSEDRFQDLTSAPVGRPYQHLTTYDGLLNHPGIISVCSVGVDGEVAAYSTPGANLWVCGASDSGKEGFGSDLRHLGLPTTDLSGNASGSNKASADDEDCELMQGNISISCFNFGRPLYGQSPDEDLPNRDIANSTNYHRFFTGTSAATPVVSGVIALMQSAAENTLTWRDVKLILAETAEQVDADGMSIGNIGWQIAGTTLGDPAARYTHHHDYGFGLVNASAAVKLASIWTRIGNIKEISVLADTLPNGEATFSVTASNRNGIDFVEYVQLEITSNYADVGALQISLTSPSDVESRLAQPRTCLDYRNQERAAATNDCKDLEGGFTFGAAAHLGEDPTGEWQLSITPAVTGSAELTVYGHTK